MEFDASVFCDDGTLPPDGPLSNWFRDIVRATEACDRQITLGARLTQIYEEAGFVDIHERIFKIPLNGWPKDEKLKEIGKIWLSNFQSGLSGFCFGIFNRAFGRSAAEIEVCEIFLRTLCTIRIWKRLTRSNCRWHWWMYDVSWPTHESMHTCLCMLFGVESHLPKTG